MLTTSIHQYRKIYHVHAMLHMCNTGKELKQEEKKI